MKTMLRSPKMRRVHHQTALWVFGFATFLLVGGLGKATSAQEKSLLWRVRSGSNTAYVLGSIHFLRKENYPLKKNIEDAFTQSRKLVLEIDLGALDGQKTDKIMFEQALNRDGLTLEENLSPETYALAENKARELGVDLRKLNPFKTWWVALTLSALKLKQLGFDPQYGVDRYFAEKAKSTGKPMTGLETLQDQLGIFDHLSRSNQEAMLRQTLQQVDALENSVETIVQAWRKGDTSLLEASLLAGMREYPELYPKLIVDRNRRWVTQIESMLRANENALIVVGSAHLVGNDGVIQLLKQRGYVVEQL